MFEDKLVRYFVIYKIVKQALLGHVIRRVVLHTCVIFCKRNGFSF